MKLGFICFNVPGHLNPMTALARQLQGRGHDVVFLYSSGAAGLPFVPGPEKDHINESRPEVSALLGEDALKFAMSMLMTQSEAILKSLPATLEATGVDALLLDVGQFYAELAAMQLGMPYIHVSAALHLDYSGYTPLCLYGWPHQTTPAALARNREGVAKFVKLVQSNNAGIRAYAKSAGLKIDWDDLSSTISPLASITQTPSAFDFESSHWPPQFHHTGPFHDDKGREKVDFPWERLTGEPLIYASMGTILNGRVDVFRTIVVALTKHRDLQLVLSAALAFAEARAKGVITGRREKESAEVAAEITKTGGTAAFVRADVAKAIDFVLSTHGRLDVAFNNAGDEIAGPLNEVTEKQTISPDLRHQRLGRPEFYEA